MATSIEEQISDNFVQVELKLDSIVQMCEDSEMSFECAEWTEERRLTLLKFDHMVTTAESQNLEAQVALLSALRRCLLRVCFAHKLAEFGIFVVYDGPGKLFPIPGIILRLIRGGAYEKL